MTRPDPPKLPDLEFRAPDCPLCGMETNPIDGCYDCESCNLTWGSDGKHGERQDPSLPRCTATCMPHEEKLPDGTPRWATLHGTVYACVLDGGHEEHTDPRSHQKIPHRGVSTGADDCSRWDWTHEWVTEVADRCDPQRGHHSDPHRGCILR